MTPDHHEPRQPPRRPNRRRLREAVQRWAAREPLRLHMLGLILVTGIVGFGTSVALLALGVGHMWLRYPLAALLAYGAFLSSVWLWVRRQRGRWLDPSGRRSSLVDPLDLLPVPDLPLPSMASATPPPVTFGGGDFGGGGAGGSFDLDVAPTTPPVSAPTSAAKHVGIGLDLDDAWPLLVAALMALTVLVASFYLVWVAPVLLGDVLLDALLAGAAYRRLRRIAPERWAIGALRRTWVPAAGVIASLTVCGYAAEWLRPGADSIGDLFRPAEAQVRAAGTSDPSPRRVNEYFRRVSP